MNLIIELSNIRKLIFVMKAIIFITPIYLLSMRFSINEFGVGFFTHLHPVYNFIQSQQFIITLLFFIGMTLFCYCMEKYILPFIVLLLITSTFSSSFFSHLKPVIEKLHKIFYKENTLLKLKELAKLDVYSHYMYIPVVGLLWIIYFGSLVAYLIGMVLLILMYLFYKSLNTFYKEYGDVKQ